MKWNFVLLISLLVSVPASVSAQRGGGGGAGHGMSRGGSRVGPARPGLSYDHGSRRGHLYDYTRSSAFWSGAAYPYAYPYYGDYWDFPNVSDDDSAPQPGPIVFVPVPQAPEPVSPPPPAPTPVLHEYPWPDSGGDGGTAFIIILKNGTVQRAIAVWAQDDRLCFITPEGASRQVVLDEVDRQNTTRINGEQKLKLPWLPQD